MLLIVAFGQPVSAAVIARPIRRLRSQRRRRSRVSELPGARTLCPGCWLPPLVARWQYQLQAQAGHRRRYRRHRRGHLPGAGRRRRLRDAGGVRHRPLRRHEGLGRRELRGEHGRRRRDPRGGRPRDLLPGRRRRRDVSPRLPTLRRLRRSVRRLPDRQPVQPGLPGRVLPEHQQRPGAAGVHPDGEPRSGEEVRGGRVRQRGVGHHRYVRGLRTPGSVSATARSSCSTRVSRTWPITTGCRSR